MATALVIHAPEDALPARALAEKLRAAKLTVVLEKASGEDVREAARGAQVAVALWSPRSVTQPAIVDDVAAVRAKTKILHAQMQNAQTPEQFRGDKSVNLTGWRGEDEFPPWRELAKLITERAGVAPLAPPAPRPPSGFFEPGRVNPATGEKIAPQPRARSARPDASRAPPRQGASEPPDAGFSDTEAPRRGGMGMVLGIAALVIVLGGGAAGFMWWQQSQSSHASAAAFDQIDRNDPAALRAFIAANSGTVKSQAEGALSELEERSYEAASDADTIEALQQFLRDFPNSQHALSARGRIAELQANPDTATDAGAAGQSDQPSEQAPPGSGAAAPGAPNAAAPTTGSPSGAPVQLTPPGEPANPQEPPSAPPTTTP
jgi:hypothetical protein